MTLKLFRLFNCKTFDNNNALKVCYESNFIYLCAAGFVVAHLCVYYKFQPIDDDAWGKATEEE